MEDFEVIRGLLRDKRSALASRVGRIAQDVRHSGLPLPADSVEQVTLRACDEVLDGLSEGARAEISRINATLDRIDRGDYGVCKECGEEIRVKRLEAVPYAEFCIDCAE